MDNQNVYTLTNQQTGQLAFKIFSFDDGRYFDHIQRNNYYSLIWLTAADGKAKVDTAEYPLSDQTLYAFAPYQPFMFSSTKLSGLVIHFHPDFFCIHKHQKEVACNGVLFNNIYHPPFMAISEQDRVMLLKIVQQIQEELANTSLAQQEALLSYLKLFLIAASRIKVNQHTVAMEAVKGAKQPFVLQRLKEAIERDFRVKHSAQDYATGLNISLKALAKTTKAYYNKTLTEIITERIVIEAKRELYLTDKTVKEIAFALGYDDEYYFSRFFKQKADVSPQLYRETVGFARGG